jgi:protein-S-isoprenylcysteine O-methyltransferase Ste14
LDARYCAGFWDRCSESDEAQAAFRVPGKTGNFRRWYASADLWDVTTLRTIAWLACCIYATVPGFWLIIHPFAERWRARRGPRYQLLLPAWIAMWLIAGAVTFPWRRVLLYDTPLAWIAGGPLIVAGFVLYAAARAGFSPAQLGGRPEIEPRSGRQQLVTSGVRQYLRHPIYAGHLCEMLGWSMGTGLAVCFALTGFAVLTGAFMIRQEDAELERRFGEAYRRYRKQVPAILPRLPLRGGANASR